MFWWAHSKLCKVRIKELHTVGLEKKSNVFPNNAPEESTIESTEESQTTEKLLSMSITNDMEDLEETDAKEKDIDKIAVDSDELFYFPAGHGLSYEFKLKDLKISPTLKLNIVQTPVGIYPNK